MSDTTGADAGAGSAARAFEDLRAEVSVLRRSIESLPAEWKSNQPPDYTPSLGAIAKKIADLTARLDSIEKHPGLRLSPAEHQAAVANVGNHLMGAAAAQLDTVTRGATSALREVQVLLGSVRTQREQLKWLAITGAAALAFGILISPFVTRLLPLGLDTRVAALVMGADRWQAGGELMAAQSPTAWRDLTLAAEALMPNKDALAACRDAAAKTRKEQRCIVIVPAPNRREPATPVGQ